MSLEKTQQTAQWKVSLSVRLVGLLLTAAIDCQSMRSHLFIYKEYLFVTFVFMSVYLSHIFSNYPYLLSHHILVREPAASRSAHVISRNGK